MNKKTIIENQKRELVKLVQSNAELIRDRNQLKDILKSETYSKVELMDRNAELKDQLGRALANNEAWREKCAAADEQSSKLRQLIDQARHSEDTFFTSLSRLRVTIEGTTRPAWGSAAHILRVTFKPRPVVNMAEVENDLLTEVIQQLGAPGWTLEGERPGYLVKTFHSNGDPNRILHELKQAESYVREMYLKAVEAADINRAVENAAKKAEADHAES